MMARIDGWIHWTSLTHVKSVDRIADACDPICCGVKLVVGDHASTPSDIDEIREPRKSDHDSRK